MTDIPLKFAIPILAVIASPLGYAIYNFTGIPAPALTQEQIDGKKFVAHMRGVNGDPCFWVNWKILGESYGRELDTSGDCRVTYNANKTQAHVELEISEGVFRSTYVADAVPSPEDKDAPAFGTGWKVTYGYETNRRVATGN
jgi:hypothetical protein